MSILRAPKAPDLNCDIGKQSFKYGLYPHVGGFEESDVVQVGYQFNVPLIPMSSLDSEASIFSINCDNIVIDTVKLAESGVRNNLVFRFYESMGGRGNATLKTQFEIKEAFNSNVLEEKLDKLVNDNNSFSFEFSPFQIVTVVVSFA